MVESKTEWSRELARSTVLDALAQIISDNTPGLIARLASDPSADKELLAVTHLVPAILPGNPEPSAFQSERKLNRELGKSKSLADIVTEVVDVRNINITGFTGIKTGPFA